MTTTVSKTFCALCVSRCGATATVADGRLVSLDPDPDHPTGRALCPKGRAAPELVADPDRLTTPLRRRGPKSGPADWEPIGWDEALDTVAERLTELAARGGPESVAFTNSSPSTSALSDSVAWIGRLRKAFGSPNYNLSMELCGWGRYLASQYVFGAAVPGDYMPDLQRAQCILFWGYNPVTSRVAHAVETTDALRRGAKLVVVDPRRVGFAGRADHWLQVRPGTDGALALALAGELLRNGWYDASFVESWTNAPLLVRADTDRLLRLADVEPGAAEDEMATWDAAEGRPVGYQPAEGRYRGTPALSGSYTVETADGPVTCRPVLDLVRSLCDEYPPHVAERITGVPADAITATARTLAEARPTAFYFWSGVEQQTGVTQFARAMGLLYALIGDFDRPGGNVAFGSPAQGEIGGDDLLPRAQRAKAIGRADRPAGPTRFGHTNSADIYRAILHDDPYPVRGLVSFGSNLLMAHADGTTGVAALRKLDFHMHADIFLNPTAELADIVLPVATPFETEALKIGFEINDRARSWIQLRSPLVEPAGHARSDVDIVFDLACRLGLGEHFWDGDVEAAYRAQLDPTGVALDDLRANPGGVAAATTTRHRKFEEPGQDGAPTGFRTPSRKIELHSDQLADHGYPALPVYEPPAVSPAGSPEVAADFPLILTSAKEKDLLESQNRSVPALRRLVPDPVLEIHPATAAARSIGDGDWVTITTPVAEAIAKAVHNEALAEDVVCGRHGWWQACGELDAPGFPATGPGTANYNLLIGADDVDPVSGSVPLRSYLCEVARLAAQPRSS